MVNYVVEDEFASDMIDMLDSGFYDQGGEYEEADDLDDIESDIDTFDMFGSDDD